MMETPASIRKQANCKHREFFIFLKRLGGYACEDCRGDKQTSVLPPVKVSTGTLAQESPR